MFEKEVAISPHVSVEGPVSGKIGLEAGRVPRMRREQGVCSKCGVDAIIAEDSKSCLNGGSIFLFQWVQPVSTLGQGEEMKNLPRNKHMKDTVPS